MNNKPVAWMVQYKGKHDFTFYKPVSHDDAVVIPLYTHPVKEQYKFGVDWSKDGKSVTVVKICEDGVAEVVFMDYQEVTQPVKELDRELLDKTIIDQQNEIKDLRKNLDVALMIVNKPELTDEEISEVFKDCTKDGILDANDFAKAILRKAQEK